MLFQDMGGAVFGGLGGLNFEIWEVLFQDMGGAVWGGGWEGKNFEIWEVLFQDMRGAVSRYERCCFEIWKVLFRDTVWEALNLLV